MPLFLLAAKKTVVIVSFRKDKLILTVARTAGSAAVCKAMVSALVPGASGLGSSPSRGHCVVFLGKTLNSHSASLHPGV